MQREEGRCIIDVNGVGYLVHASTRTLAALPPPPEAARLLVETHVREDAILLYGFADSAERDWFRLLTTVQGVGGRVALSVLSALSPRDLVSAIAAGDRASLTRAPGVGARLAVRLLTELRDKAGAMPSAPGSRRDRSASAGRGRGRAVRAGQSRLPPDGGAAGGRPRRSSGSGDAAPLDAVIRDSLKELAQRSARMSDERTAPSLPRARRRTRRRPSCARRRLAEFVGQRATRENLAIFIEAARARGEALDHVLLHGPPGLGKTTLAQIVARELGVGLPRHLGAGDPAGRRPRRDPDKPPAPGCPVHRRNPPTCSPRSRKCCTRRWRISSST